MAHLFTSGKCHHHSASGAPDCAKKTAKKYTSLCPQHQLAWAEAQKTKHATASQAAARHHSQSAHA